MILEKLHSFNMHIRFSDADPAGIVYFARYAGFFDESIISYLRSNGITWSSRTASTDNYLIPIVENKTNFKSPIRSQDEIEVYTSTLEVKEKFFKTGHFIVLNGRLVASGYLARVTVDKDSFRAISIPAKLRTVLEKIKVDKTTWEEILDSFTRKN